jgi:ATP-binding cassette, subfamily G (WHITE), member 2, SNQ2
MRIVTEDGFLYTADVNPAEFMLDAVGAGTQKQLGGDKDWADRWADSEECAQMRRDIEEINRDALKHEEAHDPEADREYSAGFIQQLKTVSERTLTAFYRNPDYGQFPLLVVGP